MTGHLKVELAVDSTGRTHIGRQSFHAPMHLSKPHWDGHYLVVQAVNCTAGLFSGDKIEVEVEAQPGSSAIMTSPSAHRAYQAREGDGYATTEQHITVKAGAWLEVNPEIFIPHKGSRVKQNTRIDTETGAGLLYIESLAPGRVASAESFAFDRLEWTTELFTDGEILARERYDLSPAEKSVIVLRNHFSDAYYASCYWVSDRTADLPGLRHEIAAMGEGETRIAASHLSFNAVSIKILAPGSMALRETIQKLREYCYASLGKPLPAWRKL